MGRWLVHSVRALNACFVDQQFLIILAWTNVYFKTILEIVMRWSQSLHTLGTRLWIPRKVELEWWFPQSHSFPRRERWSEEQSGCLMLQWSKSLQVSELKFFGFLSKLVSLLSINNNIYCFSICHFLSPLQLCPHLLFCAVTGQYITQILHLFMLCIQQYHLYYFTQLLFRSVRIIKRRNYAIIE